MSDDRKVLYVHEMFITDPDEVRRQLKAGFCCMCWPCAEARRHRGELADCLAGRQRRTGSPLYCCLASGNGGVAPVGIGRATFWKCWLGWPCSIIVAVAFGRAARRWPTAALDLTPRSPW